MAIKNFKLKFILKDKVKASFGIDNKKTWVYLREDYFGKDREVRSQTATVYIYPDTTNHDEPRFHRKFYKKVYDTLDIPSFVDETYNFAKSMSTSIESWVGESE